MFIYCVMRQVNSERTILCANTNMLEALNYVERLEQDKDSNAGEVYWVETTWLED